MPASDRCKRLELRRPLRVGALVRVRAGAHAGMVSRVVEVLDGPGSLDEGRYLTGMGRYGLETASGVADYARHELVEITRRLQR